MLFDINFLLDGKEYKINPKKDQEKKKKKQNWIREEILIRDFLIKLSWESDELT
jgi:hypothetical protein